MQQHQHDHREIQILLMCNSRIKYCIRDFLWNSPTQTWISEVVDLFWDKFFFWISQNRYRALFFLACQLIYCVISKISAQIHMWFSSGWRACQLNCFNPLLMNPILRVRYIYLPVNNAWQSSRPPSTTLPVWDPVMCVRVCLCVWVSAGVRRCVHLCACVR